MIIRPAREEDAPAMGQVMVASYLAAHRDQQPAEVWAKRTEEWTPEVSAQGWARTLREITSGGRAQDCLYVAVDEGGEIVGLAMGGPANAEEFPQTGTVYALYISTRHQGQGLGRRLVQVVAADLARKGMTHVLQWVREQDLEDLIVWPSETSVGFYKRAGFRGSPDMLEYTVRPYVL